MGVSERLFRAASHEIPTYQFFEDSLFKVCTFLTLSPQYTHDLELHYFANTVANFYNNLAGLSITWTKKVSLTPSRNLWDCLHPTTLPVWEMPGKLNSPLKKRSEFPPEKQVFQKCHQLFKEGFAHFFTLIRWSTTKSPNNATVSGLPSNSEPQGLNCHPSARTHFSLKSGPSHHPRKYRRISETLFPTLSQREISLLFFWAHLSWNVCIHPSIHHKVPLLILC